MSNLELTFLSTGECQHVFNKTDCEDEWVYKIPAAFGYIIPFNNEFRTFRPQNKFERFLRLILYRFPGYLERLLFNKRNIKESKIKSQNVGIINNNFAKLVLVQKKMGENLLALYCRRSNLIQFRRMLSLLNQLSKYSNIEDILPFEIIENGSAILRINETIINYKGPILKQRRANFFFNKTDDFDIFEWNQVIEAQHRLWKRGFAFVSVGEILGPKNWALLDDKIYIADTSSLTNNYNEAYFALCKDKLDKKEESVFDQLKTGRCLRLADDYFRFVRKEISRDKLQELWNADFK